MKTLISGQQIEERIKELGREISEYYKNTDLTVVCVMNGAMLFCSDLVRRIENPLHLDSVSVSSYENFASSGELNFRCDVKLPLKNRHVLLVDDIFDTGLTASKIAEHLKKSGALSVECCCLLNKKNVVKKAPVPRWVGFDIPEVYVVGYGLDADEKYRNLSEIFDFEA